MYTTFRNIEISNKLLDFDIQKNDLDTLKAVHKKHKFCTHGAVVEFHINNKTSRLSIRLDDPGCASNKYLNFTTLHNSKDKGLKFYTIDGSRFQNLPTKNEIDYVRRAIILFGQPNISTIFDNIDNFKHNLIDYLRNGNGNDHYTLLKLFRDFEQKDIKVINWLFNSTFDEKTIINENIIDCYEWKVKYYLDVCDMPNNKRLALGFGKENTYYWSRAVCSLWEIDHKSPIYNYVDKKTYYKDLESGPGKLQFDTSVKKPPKLFNPLQEFVRKNSTKDVIVIDQITIDKYIKKWDLKKANEKNIEKQKETVRLKLNKKVRDISKNPLKINEATFSQNQIEYQGQILKSKDVSIKDLLQSLLRFHDLNDINYDRAFGKFITMLLDKCYSFNNIDIIANIGDIEVKLYQKRSRNKNGDNYSVYYINDIRINKEEFQPVLERASCFEDINLYNKFLSQVSKCSLKIHHYLDFGLDLQIRNPIKPETTHLKLELLRKNSRQYVKIGKKERLVKNTQKLLTLEKRVLLDEIIEILLDNSVVENLTPADLKELVIIAKKAYTDAIQKSKELLERTIKTFNLKETNIDISGNSHKGYIVSSERNQYFVSYNGNKHTNDCGVYTYPNLNYVCIVDKTPNQQVGVDKFVNRIYALANDQLVAHQINTLQRTNNL